jgi:ribose 5-phosphate isomerase B
MKIYIGADHRGLALKEGLKNELSTYGEILDVGADALNQKDDFVDFAKRVSLHISGQSEARGILFCGTGVGMAIAANKFPGVRAAVGHDSEEIRLAKA